MLRELHIANLAIIEDQTLSFDRGLNVLSGETGSGKSIILTAMDLLLGGRASAQLIRSGAESLEVQGIFELDALPPVIRERLPDVAAHGRSQELCLARSLHRSGKGRAFINGRLATVSMLQEVAEALISICGQNQHVRLLAPAYHRELLDGFAGIDKDVERYHQRYQAWSSCRAALEAAESAGARSRERLQELEDIVDELSKLEPRVGERTELENTIKRMASAEQIIRDGQALLEVVQGEGGILGQMGSVAGKLSELTRADSSLVAMHELFAGARATVSECCTDLERYLARCIVDEETLERHRGRLSDLARAERRYRCDEEGLVRLLDESRKELGALGGDDQVRQLRERAETLECEVRELAEALTAERKKAARKLAREAKRELAEVSLADAELSVDLRPCALGPHGADAVELVIATNKGEEAKPLRLIASGGELARMTLVLKTLLRETSGINVLVFDEVDTGISGGVARSVGLKLKALAASSQVICVTHLPQVASLADVHILVSKVRGERTTVQIRQLNDDARIEEIARMLAGYKITPAARASAKELLSSNS